MEGPASHAARPSRLPQAPVASPASQGLARTPNSAVDDSQVLSNDIQARTADISNANKVENEERECMSLVSHTKQPVSGNTLNGRRFLTSKPAGVGPTAGSIMQLDDINLTVLQPRPPEGKPLQLAMPKLDLAKLRVRTDAAEQVEMEAAARAQTAFSTPIAIIAPSQPASRPASAASSIKANVTSNVQHQLAGTTGKGIQRTHGVPSSPGFKTPQQKAGKAAFNLHASPAALAARASIGSGPAKKAPQILASPSASPVLSPVEALRGKVAKPSSPSPAVRKSVTRLQNKKPEPESAEKSFKPFGHGLGNTIQQGETRSSVLRRSVSAQKRRTATAAPTMHAAASRPATASQQAHQEERPRAGSATRTRGVVVGSPGQGMRASHVRRSADTQTHQMSNTPTVATDTANKPLSSKTKAGGLSILSAIPERLQSKESQQTETSTTLMKQGTKPQFQLNFAALRPSADLSGAPEHVSSDRISSAGSTGKPAIPKLNLVPLMQQQEAEQYVGDAYAMSPEELANIKTAQINLPRKNGGGARKAITPDPPPQDHFYFYPKLDPEYERAMLNSVAHLPKKEQQQWRTLLNESIQAKQNCEAIAFRGHRLLDQMKDHHKEQALKQQEELEKKAEQCEVLQDEVAHLRAQLANMQLLVRSSRDQSFAGVNVGADSYADVQEASEGASKVESDTGERPYMTINCAQAAAMLGIPGTPPQQANDAGTDSRLDQNPRPEQDGNMHAFMSQQLQASQQQLQQQLDSLNKSMRQSSWTSDTSHGSSVAHRHVWAKKDQQSHVTSASRQGSSSATTEGNWQTKNSSRLQQVTSGRDISSAVPDDNNDQDVQDQDVEDSSQDNVAALLEQLRKDLQQRALSFGNDVMLAD